MHERHFEFSISRGCQPQQTVVYPTAQIVPRVMVVSAGYVQQPVAYGPMQPNVGYPMNNVNYPNYPMNTMPQYPTNPGYPGTISTEYNTNIIVQNPPTYIVENDPHHHHHHRHEFNFSVDRY